MRAAQAVVAQLGARLQPLFISGGGGVLHISYATAHGVNVARPLGVVVWVTAVAVKDRPGRLSEHPFSYR